MSISICNKSDISLRMLLEYPELLEIHSDDELPCKEKDFMTDNNKYDIQSAFLVPNIWQDTIPPEFLDISSEAFDHIDVSTWLNEQSRIKETNACMLNSSGDALSNNLQYSSHTPHTHNMYLQHYEMNYDGANPTFNEGQNTSRQTTQDVCCELSSSSTGSQMDSPRGRTNISLKAIVGDELFDPSKRSFTNDELKVVPILPKSRKNFVPSEKKDDHYWTRRLKNNTAARRSREAKRMKENQITLRTAYLEQENTRLKDELTNTIMERNDLRRRLMKYEYVTS